MYDEERAERLLGSRRRARGRDGMEPVLAVPTRDAGRTGRAGVRPRHAHGPRPVRPGVTPVAVRPAQAQWPASNAEPVLRPCRGAQRTLARRLPATAPLRVPAGPVRRLLAGLLVAGLSAAVVVGLGQLLAFTAGPVPVAASAEHPAPGGPAGGLVVVGTEPTVWDLARRLEPAASGPRLAELVERIAVDNALTSVELQPGQVLRVPPG